MVSVLESPPPLEIYLLGKFQIKVNGVLIENQRWPRESAKNLLKILALEPAHQFGREQIIDLLWENQDLGPAKEKLNKAIYIARRVLEPQIKKANESKFILTQKQQIILSSPGKLFIDTEEFERLARNAIRNDDVNSGERALDLYKGDLLTENPYEDWLTLKRESFRLLYREAATRTASIHAKNDNHPRSIEVLKKLAAEDPGDEYVQQQLMRLLALAGNKYEALKQFEQCSAALRDLGVEPEPETIELVEMIKAGRMAQQKGKLAPTAALRHPLPVSAPLLRQLTFHQGAIQSARFTPDAENIVFSAAWDGNDYEIYKLHKQGTDSIGTGLKKTGLFSISPTGELALAIDRKFLRGYVSVATIARQHFAGGVPRPLLDSIHCADWAPEKNCLQTRSERDCLLVVRDADGKNRLEYPVGNVIYQTGGWISHPRFSPDGKSIAFIDHPSLADDSGTVAIISLDGEKKTLTGSWISVQGLAWHKPNREIWFTAAKEGNARKIYAVNLAGEERLIYQGIGSLTLQDLSVEGDAALVTAEKTRIRILAKNGDGKERDLSWHDWSLVRDLSEDGQTILFTEAGESGGGLYTSYLRKTDGSPALRLGSGSALALSPGGKSALVRIPGETPRLALLPTGAGETKLLQAADSDAFFYQPWACFFPDGRRILFAANEPDKGTKLYVQEIDGSPYCLTPEEGVEISSPHSISPDGKQVAMINSEGNVCLYSMEEGNYTILKNLEAGFLPVCWSSDGRYLFVRARGLVPAAVFRYELAAGKVEEWLELIPRDSTGVNEILRVLLTPDGAAYAYSFVRELSDLYIIEALQ